MMGFRRLWTLVLTIGPGLFCIGYTIGTGSVTSMVKAGSIYGMQLLWVLFLSCLFAWTLMEAYGRFAVVTGETAIHGFRRQLRGGRLLSVLVLAGIVIGQWNSLTGILGISSNAVYETLRLAQPRLPLDQYWTVIIIAVLLSLIMYLLLLTGNYSSFERVLIIFVAVMGGSFVASLLMVSPPLAEAMRGLVPRVPDEPGAKLMIAAFVGTTMAAPTFVVRPLLLRGKGWGIEHQQMQRRDAFVSALLMLLISGAIMAVSTGVLHGTGEPVEKVLDMVETLTPTAGPLGAAIFLLGILSAGLSSVFPILMVAPLLIADYRNGRLETRTKLFRGLTAVACLVGMTVPISGVNPIFAQIFTQVANVFVLPLVVGGMMVLVNRKELMGPHRAGWLLNLGLGAALLFSLLISWTGILALVELALR